jgi:hypothetical protein
MKLKESDLMSLERYSRERPEFRARVIAHKKSRQVNVGPNTLWLFEDRLTVQYQVQEMLRTERIFEAEGIAEELAAYNPLIPDGGNWKVTFLIEYTDAEVRRVQLEKLRGIEDRCWVQVAGFERLFAIADEDLERENETKTSAVHFLRQRSRPARLFQSVSIILTTSSSWRRHRKTCARRWWWISVDPRNGDSGLRQVIAVFFGRRLALVPEQHRGIGQVRKSERGRNQSEQRAFTAAGRIDREVQHEAETHQQYT